MTIADDPTALVAMSGGTLAALREHVRRADYYALVGKQSRMLGNLGVIYELAGADEALRQAWVMCERCSSPREDDERLCAFHLDEAAREAEDAVRERDADLRAML